jgi:hypothetical protein
MNKKEEESKMEEMKGRDGVGRSREEQRRSRR